MSDHLLTLVEQWRIEASRLHIGAPDHRLLAQQVYVFNRCADELEAALRAQPRETPQTCQTWHPIETAPKDGTTVLLFYLDGVGDTPTIGTGFHAYGEWMWGDYCITPTHWQPLPSTPEPAPSAPERV